MCGIVATAFGLGVLFGYFLGFDVLVTPFPGYRGTHPVAAICLVLIGLAAIAKPRPGIALAATLSAAGLILLRVVDLNFNTALLPTITPFATILQDSANKSLPIVFGAFTVNGLLLLCLRPDTGVAWRLGCVTGRRLHRRRTLRHRPRRLSLRPVRVSRRAGTGTAIAAICAAISTVSAEPDGGVLRALLSASPPGRLARRLLTGASSWALLVGWVLTIHADPKTTALLAAEVVLAIAILSAFVTVTTVEADVSDRIRIAQEFELKYALATLRTRESELAQKISVLQTTLEQMSQGILMIDADGTVMVCNHQAVEMLNLPPDLMASRPLYTEVLADQGRTGAFDAFFAEVQDVIGAGEPFDNPRTYENDLPDGRTIEIRNVPLRDGGVLRTFSDITARRATEALLRHAQKLKAVGELAAGVAHDFNNILQIVVSNLELVMDDVAEGTAAHEFASTALDATRRGASLTGQLLAYARKQVLRPRAVELGPLFADLTRLLAGTLGPNIAMKMRLEGTPWVFADPGQLQAALLNLAFNAAHAMPQGGTLSLGGVPDNGASWVDVTVADSGTGMDAATLAHSVDPFFTTKGLLGTGLGLSMVQGFVEQSGGKFRIMSAPGLGTTVELRLPCAEQEAALT